MIRSTEEFRFVFKAVRRAGTPLVAVRTADPASGMAQITASVNGTSEQTPLLSWDFVAGLQGRNEAGKSAAVKVLGDETLRGIARELVETVRNNVTIDWTLRENVRAQLRVLVKRILRKHGYPPDKQEKATQTVLEQAALLSAEWVAA